MSIAARQATCSLTSNRCMLPSRRMTSRRSGERVPPAISVRLTTLMDRGPEDCRACTSQSRAAVSPRKCSISTSLSTKITRRPAVPGNSCARPARAPSERSAEQGADVFGVEAGAEDVTVVEHAGKQPGLPGLQRHDLLLDGVLGDQAVDHDV